MGVSELDRINRTMLKLTTPILFFMVLLISGCITLNDNGLSQQQKLNMATGRLALAYSETYSYQNSYAGIHGAKVSGDFSKIYDDVIRNLDEPYRVQYFVTALWTIPFEGGELSNFTDTLVNDSCHDEVTEILREFLEQEEQYKYQPQELALVQLVLKDLKMHLEFNGNSKELN